MHQSLVTPTPGIYFLQVNWFQMTGVLNFGFAAAFVDNNMKCLNWHGILRQLLNEMREQMTNYKQNIYLYFDL